MEENKQLKDCEEVRYIWRIENFTSLNVSEVYSGIFEVNRCRWRLLIYPKGNGVEHLSVYLDVADTDSLPVGWSRTAKFTINLINQKNSKISIKNEGEKQFKKEASNWGFTSFFALSKLHDKYGGYLVDGRCVIEAEVSVTDVFPVSTDKPSDPSVPVDRNPVDLDVVELESIYSNAKSFLMSTSKESTSILSDVPSIKERFNDMISMPLDYFVDPKHETVMMETLSILGDHLNLFSDEQAKEIVRLKAVFPTSVQEWRDSVQVKASCQSSLSTFEKTLNLLKAFVKTEEGIKTRLEELKMREQELKAQSEALQNESQRLEKERLEVSKQTQQIYALAEEQAGKVKGKEMEMAGAENKLEDLKSNWVSVKSVFIKREIFGSKHIYFGRRQFICCFLVLITAFVCYFCLNNMNSAKGTESCTKLL